ncbi:MAG TPA: glycosyltransferase [Opitutaceae bacterium]|nr:glycosyltransferase [Opitutaceae bacterium]
MPSTPLVSVVVPTYNAGAYLAELCASLCAQSLEDFEVLILSDGGDDFLHPEVVRYRQDRRFQITSWARNRGVSAATAELLRRVRGRFWCYPGADDILERDFLAARAEVATRNPRVNVIFGPGTQVDAQGAPTWYDALHVVEARMSIFDRQVIGPERMLRLLLQENVINTPSVFCRSETTIPLLLSERIEWQYAQDYHYWILLAAAVGGFHYDARPLHRYRIHGGQLSADARRSAVRLAEIRLVPLVALRAAARRSPVGAAAWQRWGGTLYALWLLRAVQLRRRGVFRPEWQQEADLAFHGRTLRRWEMAWRVGWRLLPALVSRWREKQCMDRQVWVNGLRAADDPIFRRSNAN